MAEKEKKTTKKAGSEMVGGDHFIVYNFGLQSLALGVKNEFVVKGRNNNYGNIGATIFDEQRFEELSRCETFNRYLEIGLLDTKRVFGGDALDRDLMYYSSDKFKEKLEETSEVVTPSLNDEEAIVHPFNPWNEESKNDPSKKLKVTYEGKELSKALEDAKKGVK